MQSNIYNGTQFNNVVALVSHFISKLTYEVICLKAFGAFCFSSSIYSFYLFYSRTTSLSAPYLPSVPAPHSPHNTSSFTCSPSLFLFASLLSHCASPSPRSTHCICNAACTASCDCWMGVGLQKEALLGFLFALTLLIKQASSTTTTPVS